MAKAVVYYRIDTDETIIVFIRADKDVNETKLRNYLSVDDEHLVPKTEEENDGICYGFIGPINLKPSVKFKVVYDKSLEGINSLVSGANKKDYHVKGVCLKRDIGDVDYVDVAKVNENDLCPICGEKTLTISNGIEVGNIFKLGDKYTKAFGMTYLDEQGKANTPIMGCYGIGVGRLMASILEKRGTEKETNWPHSIAPFDIHILPLDYTKNETIKEKADELYKKLTELGFDTLLDDRNKTLGVKFADSDLIGAPIKIVVSTRNLENGKFEVKISGKEQAILVDEKEIFEFLQNEKKGWTM